MSTSSLPLLSVFSVQLTNQKPVLQLTASILLWKSWTWSLVFDLSWIVSSLWRTPHL